MVEDSEEKPKLEDANKNRWYCLATLYGEQPEYDRDDELASRNRIAWNRWIAASLSPEKRATFVVKGFAAEELEPLSKAEVEDFKRAFKKRIADKTCNLPKAGEEIDFSGLQFDRYLNFSGFLFSSPVYFFGADFLNAEFRQATFLSSASFGGATFSHVDFGQAAFSSHANFTRATFSSGAYFRRVTFSSDTYFAETTFLSSASFAETTFLSSASFGGATFSSEDDYASFRGATFTSEAYFSKATFASDTYFGGTTFSSNAVFINSKLGGRTTFTAAIFETEVPDFRGATLHEATEWDDVRWPPPFDGPRVFSDRWSTQAEIEAARQQVYAYQRLKQEMEKLKKHEDELRFFSLELRAKRGTFRALSLNWCLNFLYRVTSNYGQSVGLPFAWLGAVYVSGTILLARVGTPGQPPLSLSNAAHLSFANIFSFVSLRRDFFAATNMTRFSAPVFYVSGFESILAVALLFLLALGVRNRFRIK